MKRLNLFHGSLDYKTRFHATIPYSREFTIILIILFPKVGVAKIFLEDVQRITYIFFLIVCFEMGREEEGKGKPGLSIKVCYVILISYHGT